ncbi:MAG: Holliday junction branch migration protein RuvA [Bacteroidales bacterium]|nr:Holliday junction branch migration protein RuvA [Bacteroidales bacterium]
MYEYISGKIASATATQVVIDCGGVGYLLEVSLNTYAAVKEQESARLWVHEIVREDAYLLYGFATVEEREMFRLLLSVSGVGAATARIMLSSLTVSELASAISTQNTRAVQGVKGIGAKTAQRIILELKDKVVGGQLVAALDQQTSAGGQQAAFNQNKADAQAALVMLGFPKPAVEKVLRDIDPSISVEQMMKQAMQRL